MMENLTKMDDDWGYPQFRKPAYFDNVGETMPVKPSPSHQHFYRWYTLTIPSHGGVYDIVLLTLYV